MSIKYTEGQIQDKMKRILWQWYWRHMQWRIQRIFRQTSTYIEPTNAAPWFLQRGDIFKICTFRYSKNAPPVLRFLCKTFSKLLNHKLLLQKTLPWMIFKKFLFSNNKICMAVSLWEFRSDLILKDAAGSTEGITGRSANYLYKIKIKYNRVIHYGVKWMKTLLLTVSSVASTSLSHCFSLVSIFVF